MFYQTHKKTVWLFSGLLVLLIIIGFAYGYITQLAEAKLPQDSIEPDNDNNQDYKFEDPLTRQVSITGAESALVLERFYIRCQHLLVEEVPMSTGNIGITGEELSLSFPAWKLVEFSPQRVMFTTDIDGYCPNHYIIMDKDDYLVVYASEKDTGSLYPIEQIRVRFSSLREELQEQIKVGLVVDTIEDVEHFIENLES